jgi:hypothetical protein
MEKIDIKRNIGEVMKMSLMKKMANIISKDMKKKAELNKKQEELLNKLKSFDGGKKIKKNEYNEIVSNIREVFKDELDLDSSMYIDDYYEDEKSIRFSTYDDNKDEPVFYTFEFDSLGYDDEFSEYETGIAAFLETRYDENDQKELKEMMKEFN